ncbi:MAG: DNA topoisomerase I [Bacteroidetes bacterium 4484_276]|nr:MAG: DNA topoisomerase I [Bacteroidetes bacterium 4484_276]OYT13915.1 MAG: DNA topoisomerase I [Bacteroidetes bacterium 4572_114]
MAKNLVIVESPAKAKTIERFLGKDFTVKSSFGHVRDLSKKQLGVDVDKGFKPNYIISEDKKKVIAELKKLAKDAEMVWLATDEDREGEAISWHLFETLKLEKDRTKRIVFHEITKKAIDDAINNYRSIDLNLVDAQQARRVLDRLVGFELSPVLWRKVKPALSAGRVQSVAVRLIVEREDEVKNFKVTSYYRVTADFKIENNGKVSELKAELPSRFKTKEEAVEFLNTCIGAEFSVNAIEKKPAVKKPAPPFTTSTLQQEASRKLGYSVSKTMLVAQQLYESGKITYMRTDSVNLSDLALGMAKKEITDNFGEEYHQSRKYSTTTKGAQEAHEAIRPSYLNQHEISGTSDQKRMYSLIWKRTIASQMSNARMERTTVNIGISKTSKKFVAKGEVLIFDGFLKVYLESTDEADQQAKSGVLPPLKEGQKLPLVKMDATERFTQPPVRYNEASLVKKMEELGIGRPSTYAPTISTIQKREYVLKEDRPGTIRDFNLITLKDKEISHTVKNEKTGQVKGKLIPTDIGNIVNQFLIKHFVNIMDYNFTAKVEKEFDEIALGQKAWNKMIEAFYKPFHKRVETTIEKSEKFSGEKLLGQEPENGKNIFVKIGRFGPMVQMGDTESEEKPRFAGLKKGQTLENITLQDALDLFKFPRSVGNYEDEEMTVSIGRFGPYVKHKSKFYSLAKTDDPLTVDDARAIIIIEEKRKKDREKVIKKFDENQEVQVLKGRWGPYISIGKKNIKIPKGTEPEKLSLEDCLKIAEEADKKPTKARRAKKK